MNHNQILSFLIALVGGMLVGVGVTSGSILVAMLGLVLGQIGAAGSVVFFGQADD